MKFIKYVGSIKPKQCAKFYLSTLSGCRFFGYPLGDPCSQFHEARDWPDWESRGGASIGLEGGPVRRTLTARISEAVKATA
jgi:hypothetical protein